MTFFGAISGKNYKKNVLLGDTLIALNKKSRENTRNPFVREWTLYCTTSIGIFLEKLIWNELDPREFRNVNVINRNLKKLSRNKVAFLLRSLVLQYLMWFLVNESNVAEVKKAGFTKKEFQREMFDFYLHTPEEINYFSTELESVDPTIASSRLWSHMTNVVLDQSTDDYVKDSLAFGVIAQSLLFEYYTTFVEMLGEALD